jgi:hypothetical protein
MERFGSKNTAGLVFFAVKNNLVDWRPLSPRCEGPLFPGGGTEVTVTFFLQLLFSRKYFSFI